MTLIRVRTLGRRRLEISTVFIAIPIILSLMVTLIAVWAAGLYLADRFLPPIFFKTMGGPLEFALQHGGRVTVMLILVGFGGIATLFYAVALGIRRNARAQRLRKRRRMRDGRLRC
jgi:hypothetical protein